MKANFIPAVVLSAFCFIAFRALYLRSKLAMRIALVVVAIILLVPAEMFASNYALMVPFMEWRCLPSI